MQGAADGIGAGRHILSSGVFLEAEPEFLGEKRSQVLGFGVVQGFMLLGLPSCDFYGFICSGMGLQDTGLRELRVFRLSNLILFIGPL